MRIIQLEGLGCGIVEGIVVACSSLGYRAAIDGIVGVIQQGGASNDNRGLGTGNFIAAGDGDFVMVDVRLYTTGSNIKIQRCSLCWILASSARGYESYNVELILGVFVCNFAGDCRARIVGFSSRRIRVTGGVSPVLFQILCFNCGIIADVDCFIGRNGGEFIRIICGLDFGVVAGDGDIAFCIDGVAADDSRGDLGCILDIKRAAYIKARRDCIAIFSTLALSVAVIGDGDGAAGEGGIAADLDGGNTIGGAGGFEGTVRYGEVASDVDCFSIASSGARSNLGAVGDGEVSGISSVIGHLDGTDGKGAGAGDGEALLCGYDGGKGVGAFEGQGAVGGGSKFEGAFGNAVKGDYTILIAGDGAVARRLTKALAMPMP